MSDIGTLVTLAAIGAAVLVILSWAMIGARMWRQRERNAFADKLARSEAPPKGPFAVYLRAFKHPAYVAVDTNIGDQIKALVGSRHTGADGRSGTRPLEGVLADILDKEMPLVGLGRPNAGLSKSGAGLVRTTDEEWQKVVTSLLDRCSLIVMTPAGTAGTAWEIEQLGIKEAWREKTIYFMPNYHVELIRALQPFVMGHETLFGTSRFVLPKVGKPKPPGSIIIYSVRIFVGAFIGLGFAIARCIADVAFSFVLLFQRFAQSFGLRGRWGAARSAGRRHGLAFPSYTAKGRIFTLDEKGKAHKLADLHDISLDHFRDEVMKFAREADKRRQRREALAAATPAIAPAPVAAPLAEASLETPAPEVITESPPQDFVADAPSPFGEVAAITSDEQPAPTREDPVEQVESEQRSA